MLQNIESSNKTKTKTKTIKDWLQIIRLCGYRFMPYTEHTEQIQKSDKTIVLQELEKRITGFLSQGYEVEARTILFDRTLVLMVHKTENDLMLTATRHELSVKYDLPHKYYIRTLEELING